VVVVAVEPGGMAVEMTSATAAATEDTSPVTAVGVVAGMGAAGGDETDHARTLRGGAAPLPAPARETAAPPPRADLAPVPLPGGGPAPTHKRRAHCWFAQCP